MGTGMNLGMSSNWGASYSGKDYGGLGMSIADKGKGDSFVGFDS